MTTIKYSKLNSRTDLEEKSKIELNNLYKTFLVFSKAKLISISQFIPDEGIKPPVVLLQLVNDLEKNIVYQIDNLNIPSKDSGEYLDLLDYINKLEKYLTVFYMIGQKLMSIKNVYIYNGRVVDFFKYVLLYKATLDHVKPDPRILQSSNQFVNIDNTYKTFISLSKNILLQINKLIVKPVLKPLTLIKSIDTFIDTHENFEKSISIKGTTEYKEARNLLLGIEQYLKFFYTIGHSIINVKYTFNGSFINLFQYVQVYKAKLLKPPSRTPFVKKAPFKLKTSVIHEFDKKLKKNSSRRKSKRSSRRKSKRSSRRKSKSKRSSRRKSKSKRSSRRKSKRSSRRKSKSKRSRK